MGGLSGNSAMQYKASRQEGSEAGVAQAKTNNRAVRPELLPSRTQLNSAKLRCLFAQSRRRDGSAAWLGRGRETATTCDILRPASSGALSKARTAD